MKFNGIVSSSIEQTHDVTVENKGEFFLLTVTTKDGVVVGGYHSVITANGQYFSLSDATRKMHFNDLKQYIEAALRAKAVTSDKIIYDFNKYNGQLANDKKVSATKFHAMQEAIYGCKVIVRRLFGEKQKVENAIVK